MSDRPILFSAAMVRALLAGTKTQTRRIIKGARGAFWDHAGWAPQFCHDSVLWRTHDGEHEHRMPIRVPYAAGDTLWVKEAIRHGGGGCSEYIADGTPTVADAWPWKPKALPGMFCPRGLSRITLAVTDVRVQRLQEISKEDAHAEGARGMLASGAMWPQSAAKWSMEYPHPVEIDPEHGDQHCLGSPQMAFANKWIAINSKRPGCSWDDNPWAWAVTFQVVQP